MQTAGMILIAVGVLLRGLSVAKSLSLAWREGWRPWRWLLIVGPAAVLLAMLSLKPSHWPLLAFFAEVPFMVAFGGASRPDDRLVPAFRLYPAGLCLAWMGCFLAFAAAR